MSKIKNLIIILFLGFIWAKSSTFVENKTKILLVNHDAIAWLIGEIGGLIITLLVIVILIAIRIIKIEPLKTGDPYLDDSEWNTGKWNSDAHEAKNQNQ